MTLAASLRCKRLLRIEPFPDTIELQLSVIVAHRISTGEPTMNPSLGIRLASLVIFASAVDVVALGVERIPTTTITLQALQSKLEEKLGADSDDVDAYIELAKMHCLAYAHNRALFTVTDAPEEPELVQIRERTPFPNRWSTHVLTVTGGRITHLAKAIPLLRKAAELEPTRYEAHLGLGYAYMEAAERWTAGDWLREQVTFDEVALEEVGAKVYWENLALASLSTARALIETKDSENLEGEKGLGDLSIVYSLMILSRRESLTPEEEALLDLVREEALNCASQFQRTLWVAGRPLPRTDSIAPPEVMQKIDTLYPYVAPEANGAEYYVEALNAQVELDVPYDAPVPFYGEYKWGIPSDPLSEEGVQIMDQILAANGESLRLLHEGARFTRHRYPVDFSMGMDLGHLAGVRQLARLAAMQAVLAAERQQTTVATEALLDGVALARSLDAEPTMVSQLVRLACAGIIVDAAQQVINRTTLSDSNLAQLQAGLATQDSPEPMIGAYEGEKWTVELPMPPISAEDMRFSRGGEPPVYRVDGGTEGGATPSPEEMKAFEEKQRLQFQTMQKERLADINACLEKLRLPVHETYLFVKLPADIDVSNPASSLGDRGPSPMQRAITAYIRCTASVRVAQAALAVERFRVRNQSVPDSIEDLVPSYLPLDSAVDPFTNETLLYQVSEDRFVVYSVADPLYNAKVQMEYPEALSAISFTVVY